MTPYQKDNAFQNSKLHLVSDQQKPLVDLELNKESMGSISSFFDFAITETVESISLFSGTVPAAYPDNEEERIQKLLRYRILDTEPESVYDDLTALAAHICGTTTALVCLIDVGRQWFKSRIGIDATETPRELAFCTHTILQSEVMVVPDTWADERFVNHPLTTGSPHIRFYAGAPLLTAEGFAMGTLCVIDSEPKQLTLDQIRALEVLAHQVVSQLDMRLMSQQIQKERAKREKADEARQQMTIDLENHIRKRTELLRYENRQLKRTLEKLQHDFSHSSKESEKVEESL